MKQEKIEAYKRLAASGEIYDSVDQELLLAQHECVERLNQFNATPDTPEGLARREQLLKEILGRHNNLPYIIPPIYSNWGLKNVHIGRDVVFNFGTCIVDDGPVYVGDDSLIGPGCHIVTSIHPVSPRLRRKKLQYNKPVRLGNNVWLGAGAIILPGVTIGDNSIVGAGSVVTHDVPSDTIVVGNPAKVLRKITAEDDRFYDGGKAIPANLLSTEKL